jgi:hypothetical protein
MFLVQVLHRVLLSNGVKNMTIRIALFVLFVSAMAAFGLFTQARAEDRPPNVQIGLLSMQPADCTLHAVVDDKRVRLTVKCPGLEFGAFDIDRKLVGPNFTAVESDMSPPK